MKSYYLIDNDPMNHKCETLREVRYRAESRGDLWGEIVLKVDGKSEEATPVGQLVETRKGARISRL